LAAPLLASTLIASSCQKNEKIIGRLDDAVHAKIGVMTGTTGEVFARARFPQADIKSFDDIMDAVAATNSGQLDGIVTAHPTAVEVAKKNPRFTILDESLGLEDTSVAIRKGNKKLLAEVNQVIATLQRDGTLASMKKRWFERESNPFDKPKIDLPTGGTTLRIGVCATRVPFTFMDKDGRVTGHDGELARRIGAMLHRPIEFSNMRFMALIPALQSGKVDMIVTGMTATNERRQFVDFSDPYFKNSQVLMIWKSGEPTKLVFTADYHSPSFVASLVNSFRSNILEENRYLLIWDGLKTTLVISICSMIFGTLLGAVVCGMRMSRLRVLNAPARLYITILRGTPVLVLLMIIFYVVFASVNVNPVLVAVIAFGMNFAGYVSEIFRTGIESVDKGQTEAGIAMGFSRVETFLYIVLPQTVRRILPVYKGEFISLVKMTSIVGYIAVQDLTKASDVIRSRTFDAFFPLIMVAILYFAISWVLTQALVYLEHVTDPKYRPGGAAHA